MNREEFGLRAWTGSVVTMLEPHQHDEIELNYVLEGELHYLFGGFDVALRAGQWMAFWGTWPHHLTLSPANTRCVWVTLPFATYLRFGLPETVNQTILGGQPVKHLETNPEDHLMFQRWATCLEPGEPQRILELELEARLRRLALGLPTTPAKHGKQHGKAAKLAQFISQHYLEPISLSDIAASANLSPNHASGVFKEGFAMTLLAYLTQHRIAHAQRLLATSDAGVLEVAFASGFGSSSAFYVAFERACGLRPLEYRRKARSGS